MADFNQDFRDRKQQMTILLDAIERLAASRGKKEIVTDMRAQKNHLQKGELNVMVCGEFKRGKSSLLNAFLEEDGICPVDAPIATNAISRISYGEEERVTIHVEENGRKISRQILLKEVDQYVTEGANPSTGGVKVNMVDIQLPNPKLKNGLVLYDTPGVGSLNKAHTATTHAILPLADAVLFVGVANAPLATGELQFLKDIAKYRPHLFHVLTMRDIPPNPEEILASNLEMIALTLGVPKGKVKGISVSSRYKLLWMDDREDDLLQDSRFVEFENAMWELLRNGGNILLARTQVQALLAISHLLPPLEAEFAAMKAKTKEELAGLDAQLQEQIAKGKALDSDSSDWMGEADRRSRLLKADCARELDNQLRELFNDLEEYVERFGEDYSSLAEFLVKECSGRFSLVLNSANKKLGALLRDLRELTNMNPTGKLIQGDYSIPLALQPQMPPDMKVMQKVVHAGRSVAMHTGGFAAAGGLLGGALGIFGGPVGMAVGAKLGATLGGLFGTAVGAKEGFKEVLVRDHEGRKKAILDEARKQFQSAFGLAKDKLNEFVDESVYSIQSSLRKEIRSAVTTSVEARDALSRQYRFSASEAEKMVREKESTLQSIYSCRTKIQMLVPAEENTTADSDER